MVKVKCEPVSRAFSRWKSQYFWYFGLSLGLWTCHASDLRVTDTHLRETGDSLISDVYACYEEFHR